MAKRKAAKLPKGDAKTTDMHLEIIQEELEKEFGSGSAMSLDSSMSLSKIDHWCSSRSVVVDKVLAGGRPLPCSLVPYGRQIEVSGVPNSGKTTLCAQIAAEVQRNGGLVIVTDTEERIAHDYWQTLGVDTSRVLNLRADTLEEVFDKQYTAIRIMREKAPERLMMMLWDSVGGTSSGKVLDDDAAPGDSVMDRAAKLMGREAKTIGNGAKVLNNLIAKSKIMYLYTNHVYTKMNVKFGDPMETYGGQKLKFMATVRLRLHPIGEIKEEDEFGNKQKVGQRVRVKALKNSMAPMQFERDAVILGGKGFSNEYTVWEMSKKMKLTSTKGSWSSWETPDGEIVKFQGWAGFSDKVVSHDEYPDLEAQVLEAL